MELEYKAGMTLAEKATSAFPLAIGTSLAFESVFSPIQEPYDPKREIPDKVDPTSYQTCWINITTLFRNLSGAVEKGVFVSASPDMIAATLEEEIEVINSLFENEARGLCKPVFYYSTYEKLLKREVPGLRFRLPETVNQKHYDGLMKETIKRMERHTDSIIRFDGAVIPDRQDRSFVLTHQPYDLTEFRKFAQLDLLESNTGAVKPKSRWNSKYYPMSGKSFVHLPFHRKILLVLGDKVLVRPMLSAVREKVLEVSLQRNWNPATTLDKVKLDLEVSIRDPYMMSILKEL